MNNSFFRKTDENVVVYRDLKPVTIKVGRKFRVGTKLSYK